MSRGIRFLSGENVNAALPMKEAVEVMKRAFGQLSAGEVVVPLRTHIEATGGAHGDALFMPSYSPGEQRMGLKIVTLFKDNPAIGLPFIQAIVIVLDGKTGRPLAIMDGATLTAIRTGAASGAATDLLARADATRAAIFGAGPQARTQLRAICAVRPIRQVRVFDADRARREAFAREMSEQLGIVVEAAASASAAVAGADVICTATTSATPVFDDGDIAPGTHINAIGSYKPAVREIPGQTVRRARVVVDHFASAWAETGDLLIPLGEGLITREHVEAELGQIVLGIRPGRQSAEQITFFKSVGVAIQDLAAATAALGNAERMGLGVELQL